MALTQLLTTEDLDQVGCSFSQQPLEKAVELIDAVDRGLLADPADAGYALVLAAELNERDGDLETAQRLAGRAIGAYRDHDDSDYGYAQAFRARLLLRLGRDDEAMAEWTALRPMLSEDYDIVSYLTEAMEQAGFTELIEQWLTEALPVALQRQKDLESRSGEPDPDHQEAGEVVSIVARHRYRLRRELNLPHDERDLLHDPEDI